MQPQNEADQAELACASGAFCPTPSQQYECPAGSYCVTGSVEPITCDYAHLLNTTPYMGEQARKVWATPPTHDPPCAATPQDDGQSMGC